MKHQLIAGKGHNITNPIKEKIVMEEFMRNLFEKATDCFGAILVAFVGYFSPLSHVVHVVLICFLADVVYGWLADKKLNKAPFKPSLVWKKTMPRVLLSLVLLILSYVIDKETGQTFVDSYRILGWAICGLLFMSIIKNAYIVTNWGAINSIDRWARKKVKDETGLTIKDSEL